jgi:hypothetical protein
MAFDRKRLRQTFSLSNLKTMKPLLQFLSYLLPAGRNASIRCYSLEKSLNRPACRLFFIH